MSKETPKDQAPDPSLDPMYYFRTMLTQWENASNELGNKISSTPEFAKLMGQTTNATVQIQSAMNDAMGKMLSTANMPSKSDIDAISSRLTNIENQLSKIDAKLSGKDGGIGARPKVSRTRKAAPKTK